MALINITDKTQDRPFLLKFGRLTIKKTYVANISRPGLQIPPFVKDWHTLFLYRGNDKKSVFSIKRVRVRVSKLK